MSHLPVIVGFGGINPAGRSSFHHSYRRLIIEKLTPEARAATLLSLATISNLVTVTKDQEHYQTELGEFHSLASLVESISEQVLKNSLIRKIDKQHFDVNAMTFNKATALKAIEPLCFSLTKRQLPNVIPENWQLEELADNLFKITVTGELPVILPDTKEAAVKTAGQLPTGFEPGKLYQSRNHPRNLQMTIYAASDAISSCGIPFEDIADAVSPDDIAVYASNSIGQLDDLGFGGLTKYPSIGKRITSKQMPLGYAQMPADFVNAYVIGNVGSTGGSLGACATFLYNLRNGVQDIREGRKKVVLVGGSDAPITPEIIEGFRTMGALAEDKDLKALNNVDELTDEHYRTSCRPFAENCGFTIGESSQFVLLMNDELALELGAQIHGAVPDVFVNADGHKKSISAPGIGNYITLSKSAALISAILGKESLQQRSFVQAHGTSTPQNRVTESHVINQVAKAFAIDKWPVAAIKCYLGHSQGTAGGDQLASSLGTWAYGYIPGIATSESFADDVHQSNLLLSREHLNVGVTGMDSVILNSKGFGGNNASAPVLSPHIVKDMLLNKHGAEKFKQWQTLNVQVDAKAQAYDASACRGEVKPSYKFNHNVLEGDDLTITDSQIDIPGYKNSIDISQANPFDDYCK
ncbi:MAG: beta-ketoacyl synthase [Oceanospirillaceae bacterium]|nr:beta-ketoacyl synthase [Oceanospirillaceae bacterium]